jgi:hypothetical protein
MSDKNDKGQKPKKEDQKPPKPKPPGDRIEKGEDPPKRKSSDK